MYPPTVPATPVSVNVAPALTSWGKAAADRWHLVEHHPVAAVGAEGERLPAVGGLAIGGDERVRRAAGDPRRRGERDRGKGDRDVAGVGRVEDRRAGNAEEGSVADRRAGPGRRGDRRERGGGCSGDGCDEAQRRAIRQREREGLAAGAGERVAVGAEVEPAVGAPVQPARCLRWPPVHSLPRAPVAAKPDSSTEPAVPAITGGMRAMRRARRAYSQAPGRASACPKRRWKERRVNMPVVPAHGGRCRMSPGETLSAVSGRP